MQFDLVRNVCGWADQVSSFDLPLFWMVNWDFIVWRFGAIVDDWDFDKVNLDEGSQKKRDLLNEGCKIEHPLEDQKCLVFNCQ